MIIKMPLRSGREMDRIIGIHLFHRRLQTIEDFYERLSKTSEVFEYEDVADQIEFPRYSKDIKYAWEVVDHFVRETEAIQYEFRLSRKIDYGNRVWGFEAGFFTQDFQFSAWDLSAPTAICRAAIEIIIDYTGKNYAARSPK